VKRTFFTDSHESDADMTSLYSVPAGQGKLEKEFA